MQAADIIKDVIAILSSPAWGGVGGMAALVSIPLSIFLARQSQRYDGKTATCASIWAKTQI